ncbi:MAG: hypothetical protein GOU98_03245 [Candidatus Altiarchaeota archaeon]|nr:hypothetical protein [Candidatus Altiarchaeota archaeon]
MIYDKSMNKLAKKAGLEPSLARIFLPFFIVPPLLLSYGPLAVLVSFMVVLRLPHLFFWYFSKERRRHVKHELPLIISEVLWQSKHVPLQEVLGKLSGKTGQIFSIFSKNYASGKSFEASLDSCAIFPEIVELNKRLKTMYKTGSGEKLLELYSKKIMAENLAIQRTSAARMQIFAICYTALAAILPSMYSGLSIYSQNTSIFLPALLLSSLLVVLWKVVY